MTRWGAIYNGAVIGGGAGLQLSASEWAQHVGQGMLIAGVLLTALDIYIAWGRSR